MTTSELTSETASAARVGAPEQLRLFGWLDGELEARRKQDEWTFCIDCQVDPSTTGELFYLRDDIWLEAHPDSKGWLCVGCVEARLGRQLVPDDFDDTWPRSGTTLRQGRESDRLRDRLTGFRELMRERERERDRTAAGGPGEEGAAA